MIHNCHYIFYLLCKPNSFKYLCTLLKKNQHLMFMSDWILMSYQESCKYLKVLEMFNMFTQWKESKMQDMWFCVFVFLVFVFFMLAESRYTCMSWCWPCKPWPSQEEESKNTSFLWQTHEHLTISTWQKKRITFLQFKITTANVCPLLS